jgi:hypothetical protein
MSHLQSKSNDLVKAAALLHNEKLFPAVAHPAYYSCYQQMKHIWIYSMRKTQRDLDALCRVSNAGVHKSLINEMGEHMKATGKRERQRNAHEFKSKILQLRKLRVSADYENAPFDSADSQSAMRLAADVAQILKNYM